MKIRIELRDRDESFVTTLDERVRDLGWSYGREGGCNQFSFAVSSKFCTEVDLGANFNVRIYRRNMSTGAYDLKYQGRVENTEPSMSGSREVMNVQGFGYQSELKDIIINQTYNATEISAIVKDILDNHVTANTNISYDAGDIVDTGFTPSGDVKFSYVTALEAFRKLSGIVGSREWGVDKNRKFFFKERSSDANTFIALEQDIESFRLQFSSREIVNRVIVVGGDVSGTKFVYTKDYTQNQNKYKRRDLSIQNSAIVTSDVAEQFADAFQADNDGVQARGSFIFKDDVFLEDTIPIPLVDFQTRETLYDELEYDNFLYAGLENFRINRINYKADINGIITAGVEFGKNIPKITEDIKQLQFDINQIVQSEA